MAAKKVVALYCPCTYTYISKTATDQVKIAGPVQVQELHFRFAAGNRYKHAVPSPGKFCIPTRSLADIRGTGTRVFALEGFLFLTAAVCEGKTRFQFSWMVLRRYLFFFSSFSSVSKANAKSTWKTTLKKLVDGSA